MIKIFVIKRARNCHLLCKRPGCCHSPSETHVRDMILKLSTIHASVVYQIPRNSIKSIDYAYRSRKLDQSRYINGIRFMRSAFNLISVCMEGFYASGITCLPCDKGSFNNQLNETTCDPCPGNQTTMATGSPSQDQCGNFLYSLLFSVCHVGGKPLTKRYPCWCIMFSIRSPNNIDLNRYELASFQ